MPKSLPKSPSNVVTALIILLSLSGVAVRETSALQGSVRTQPTEVQQAVGNIANLAAQARTDADAAGAAQGRDQVKSLIGSVTSLQQGIQSFINKAGRMVKGDAKKDVDAMGQQLATLKKEEELLMKLMSEKSDDATRRRTVTQRLHNLTNEIEGTAKRIQTPR